MSGAMRGSKRYSVFQELSLQQARATPPKPSHRRNNSLPSNELERLGNLERHERAGARKSTALRESYNQSPKRASLRQSLDKSFEKSFDKSFDKAFDKALDKSFDKLFDESFDKSFDKENISRSERGAKGWRMEGPCPAALEEMSINEESDVEVEYEPLVDCAPGPEFDVGESYRMYNDSQEINFTVQQLQSSGRGVREYTVLISELRMGGEAVAH